MSQPWHTPLATLGMPTDEQYSTEQGVKAEQMRGAADEPTLAPAPVPWERSVAVSACDLVGPTRRHVWRAAGRDESSEPLTHLESSERFDLIVCSDVIYSAAHAAQLATVISRRLRPGGRCASPSS